MNWTDETIKGKILHKLSRHGKFQHSHTAMEHLHTGFPAHVVGQVKDMISALKSEGLLLVKHTNYGAQVSINVKQLERVMQYIDDFLKEKN
ncbi:hypothetical protein HY490_03280 [Candidatus Woesearchaeota archaeon]|nr:hypothetical protein [Candidatus Woesearchaeota archaeon]